MLKKHCAILLLAVTVSATSAFAMPAMAAAPSKTTAAVVPLPSETTDQQTDAFTQMKADLGVTGMKNQEDLNAFRSWLNDRAGLYDAGFYEAAIDIQSRTMTLLWHGTSALQNQVIDEGIKRGLHVKVQAVPYTKNQVDAALL